MFKETNDRLARAVKDKDLKRMPVLQELLNVALTKMNKARKEFVQWEAERNSLDRKRIKLLNESKV